VKAVSKIRIRISPYTGYMIGAMTFSLCGILSLIYWAAGYSTYIPLSIVAYIGCWMMILCWKMEVD
jgi:hypothetical protein